MENKITPKLMTVKQIAETGILSEYCLRRMLKAGQLPAIYSGKKALINYNALCEHLNSLSVNI